MIGAAIVTLGVCAQARSDVIHVPGDAPTIRAGVELAVGGDAVVLADGLYTGMGNTNIDFGGKLITVRSASGDPAACVIDCGGAGRGFHFHGGESAGAVVSGLTVTGGDAEWGGGMLIEGASPSVIDCRLGGNTASLGGGVYVSDAAPNLVGCVFTENTAELGAGIYALDAPVTVALCTFSGNDATVNGGGMYIVGDSAAVTDCTFLDNSAAHGGGGIYGISGSPAVTGCAFSGNLADFGGGLSTENERALVCGCTFTANVATAKGGALRAEGAQLAVTGCTFFENQAAEGGAVHSNNGATPGMVLNCLFDGNTAVTLGGAFSVTLVTGDLLINCTFTANEAPTGSALHAGRFSPMTVLNSIVWGGGAARIADPGGLAVVSYSDVEGGWTGAGANNLNADPMLDGEKQLLPGSPCIDAADNTAVPPGTTTDLAGGPRFLDDPAAPDSGNPDGVNPIVDTGACERQPSCAADCGDRDGTVGVTDLLALLAQWSLTAGSCDLGLGAPGTGVEELLALLAGWGPCR